MESWKEKLQSRETIAAMATTLVFILTISGVGGVEADDVEKLITGIVSAVTLAAFILNRATVKKAEIEAGSKVYSAELANFPGLGEH